MFLLAYALFLNCGLSLNTGMFFDSSFGSKVNIEDLFGMDLRVVFRGIEIDIEIREQPLD